MKNTKKFAAMIAALTLSACSIAPMFSFAVEESELTEAGQTAYNTYLESNSGATVDEWLATVTDETLKATYVASAPSTPTTNSGSIEISNVKEGHTYEAYQIFKGTLFEGVLSNIDWGDGVVETKDGKNLIDEIKNISVGNKKPFENCISASGVAKELAKTQDKDAEITMKFASVVGEFLADAAQGSTNTFEDGKYKISDVPAGYYLVKDKDDSLNEKDDAYTRYIVEVLGNKTNIAPKSSKPAVEKKVLENVKTVSGKPVNDPKTNEKWNDVADYNIGDAVPFKLYGKLPSATEYAQYDAYYYEFEDTLGTQFDMPKSVTIKVDGVAVEDQPMNSDIITTIDSTTHKINVVIENIKEIAPNGTETITVEYTAVLNKTANIGLPGQINAVDLVYSNNPNEKYTPSKTPDKPEKPGTPEDETPDTPDTPKDEGKTPEDKVIVFTYELDTTKVSKDDNTKKLQGAEFKMKNTDNKYAKVDENGIFEGWVDEADASTLTSDANGKFIVKGIDDGTYTLIETKAPAGYDTPQGKAAEFEVALKAETVNNQTWHDFDPKKALTKLDLNSAEQDATSHGVAQMQIENGKGSTLPSTGGIGTTIFYLGGGAMVAVAGVFLITKKRMGKSEN